MRRLVLTKCLGSVVLVASLAGCGSGETGALDGAGSSSTTTSIVTDPDGTRYAAHAGVWKLVAAEDGGRVLSIVVPVSGCTKFREMEVDEQPGSVRLTAVVETFVEGPKDSELEVTCGAELGLRDVSVELREPLGDRELLGECDPGGPSKLDCSLF